MSGSTAAKVTGLASDVGAAVASGAALRFHWTAYPGADEYRAEASPDGANWQSWGRVNTTTFSKGGAVDAPWRIRVVARRSGADIAGSASDPITVRVGPVPAAAPAPAPAPDLAARVAALESAVAALKSQAASGIQATGTLALAVQGQAQEVPATATMTLTPVAATK